MPETTEFEYSYKELATLLVKDRGLHEGIWGVTINFALNATNFGPNKEEVIPTAILHVVTIALRKHDQVTNVSVNAAEVNPLDT